MMLQVMDLEPMDVDHVKEDKKCDAVKHKHSGSTASYPSSFRDEFEKEISDLYLSVPEVANHFIILDRIGEGAFSTVYKARLKHYPEVEEMFALKHIVPTSHPSRIENELKCLLKMGGTDNVMGVKLCIRNKDHVIVVMPLFSHDKFQDILPVIGVWEMREYMRNLLIALRRVHEFNVIHRDIKPSNFLYNRLGKEYALVDFGLASFSTSEVTGATAKPTRRHSYESGSTSKGSTSLNGRDMRSPLSPAKRAINKSNIAASSKSRGMAEKVGKPVAGSTSLAASSSRQSQGASATALSVGLCGCFGKPTVCHLCIARSNQIAPRAGTSGFRAPEVLLKSPDQDTAVDVWSAGVIFLSMLSGRYPFFRAQDDLGYLAQIVSLLGTDVCVKAAHSFGKTLTVSEQIPSVDFRYACHKLRSSQINPRSQTADVRESWEEISDLPYDLLAKMLDPNPRTRITAQDALEHQFFSETSHSS